MSHAVPPKSADQFTAEIVKKQLKEKFGRDVDPDTTFVVTFAYNKHGHTPPYPAQIISKQTLTEVAQRNLQHTDKTDVVDVLRGDEQYDPEVSLKTQKQIPITKGPVFERQFDTTPDQKTRFYQGIYTEPAASSPDNYDASNRIPVSVKDFQQAVWDTSYSVPYRAYLSAEISKGELARKNLSKIAFINAAETQHQESSLDDDDMELARRVAGAGNKPRDQLSLFDDIHDHRLDPQVETKFLTLNGRASTDIFYAVDKKTSRTLLYLPGNSSPIHPFENPGKMHDWLRKQFSLPNAKDAFLEHFQMADHDEVKRVMRNVGDGYRRFGPNDWPESRQDQSIVRGVRHDGDPFYESGRRWGEHRLNDISEQFVSNKQVTEGLLLDAAKTLGNGLLSMGAIAATFIPGPIGVFAAVALATHGAIEVGEGIKDARDGKPGAAQRITFGALNALPLVGRGVFKVAKGVTNAGKNPLPKAPSAGAPVKPIGAPKPLSASQLRIDKHVASIEQKIVSVHKALKTSPKELFVTHDANNAIAALQRQRAGWQSGELLPSSKGLSNSPLATGANRQRAILENNSQSTIDKLFTKINDAYLKADASYGRATSTAQEARNKYQIANNLYQKRNPTLPNDKVVELQDNLAQAVKALEKVPVPAEINALQATRDTLENMLFEIKPHTSLAANAGPKAT
ncbi:hypothetical protein LRS56_03800 [Pseudomonas poae]|nr:hypothetical protein LRS56_03800 [Pseudomonas poae]